MMKILRAMSVLLGAAILVLGASAGHASAGGIDGWGSCGARGGSGGYGYSGRGGCGYGACGSGGCGLSAAGGDTCRYVGDYARYVIGHGPMYPAGDYSTGYSYGTPTAPNTSAGPNSR
jgi:hypothetical protein